MPDSLEQDLPAVEAPEAPALARRLIELVSSTGAEVRTGLGDLADGPLWEAVHGKFRGPLERLCLAGGMGADEAADMVQEIFADLVRLLQSPPRSPSDFGLRELLADLAHRRLVAHHADLREFRANVRALERTAAMLGGGPGPGPAPSLQSLAVARVRLRADPLHWQAFEAYAWGGRSSREVGKAFGLSGVEVRMIRLRLTRRIRAELARLADSGHLKLP